jgi:hemerythrin-like domain-containing protein
MNSERSNVDVPAIVQQTQLELEMLAHIKRALKGSIQASVVGDDSSRKLANVRFVTSSLQRYVERAFAMEEHDGYMIELRATHPHLLHKLNRLSDEHDHLRSSLRRIVPRLDLLPPDDLPALENLCRELSAFVAELDRHVHTEVQLLEEAYLQDIGGESGT